MRKLQSLICNLGFSLALSLLLIGVLLFQTAKPVQAQANMPNLAACTETQMLNPLWDA